MTASNVISSQNKLKHATLVGLRFGRLVVQEVIHRKESNGLIWAARCLCDCGHETVTRIERLKKETTRSCGCWQNERLVTHGQTIKAEDGRRPKIYQIWNSMVGRCYRPSDTNYWKYGAKGILVSDEWRVFQNFFEDMGCIPLGMTLERKDSKGNYEKENCCWASRIEQANNKSNNVLLTANGKTMTMAQWAREVGIDRSVLANRFKRKWPDHEIIFGRPRKQSKAIPIYTVGNESLPISEWSRRSGISPDMLKYRMRQGWSLESAISVPTKPQRPNNSPKPALPIPPG